MKRALTVLAVLALLVALPATAVAARKHRPAAVTAVTALDIAGTTFTVGDTVPFTWSYAADLAYGESLWARMDCIIPDGSVGQTQWVSPVRDPNEFHIGPTPSWDGTTGASCTAVLYLFDAFAGGWSDTGAGDTFEVTPA